MYRTIVTAAAAAVLAAMVGCGPVASSDDSGSGGGSGTDATGTSAGESSQADHRYGWGETAEFGEVAVSVTEPEPFTTSATAMPEQNTQAWKVTITITNGSDEAMNPVTWQIKGRNGSATTPDVMDSDNNLTAGMNVGDIAPGGEVSFEQGYIAGDGEPAVVVSQSLGDGIARFE